MRMPPCLPHLGECSPEHWWSWAFSEQYHPPFVGSGIAPGGVEGMTVTAADTGSNSVHEITGWASRESTRSGCWSTGA